MTVDSVWQRLRRSLFAVGMDSWARGYANQLLQGDGMSHLLGLFGFRIVEAGSSLRKLVANKASAAVPVNQPGLR
jgi:hypothetical protein